jgi:hypothetical protein
MSNVPIMDGKVDEFDEFRSFFKKINLNEFIF